jgi:hypothetical protein
MLRSKEMLTEIKNVEQKKIHFLQTKIIIKNQRVQL